MTPTIATRRRLAPAPVGKDAPSLRRLIDDRTGYFLTEYVILLGLVAIVSLTGFFALGVSIIDDFKHARAQILVPRM